MSVSISYELRVHQAERDAFDKLELDKTRWLNVMQDVASNRHILSHPKAEELDGTDIVKIRTGDYRTFVKRDGIHLDVLMVRHRKNAYRDLETAKERAGEI